MSTSTRYPVCLRSDFTAGNAKRLFSQWRNIAAFFSLSFLLSGAIITREKMWRDTKSPNIKDDGNDNKCCESQGKTGGTMAE